MPRGEQSIWLMLISFVLILSFFPLFGFIFDAQTEIWQLVLVANVLFPLLLLSLSQELLWGVVSQKTHSAGKTPRKSLKLPGLELSVSVRWVSLLFGLVLVLLGLPGFLENYSTSSYGGLNFFNGLYYAMIILWGVAIVPILYYHLRSRKISHSHYITFHVYAPILGMAVGVVASIHVLFVMLYRYLYSFGNLGLTVPDGMLLSAFFMFLLQSGANSISPVALTLIFGIFMVEAIIILSSFASRTNYGSNQIIESQLIARNLFLALVFYSAMFFVVPSLFSPIIWSLGLV